MTLKLNTQINNHVVFIDINAVIMCADAQFNICLGFNQHNKTCIFFVDVTYVGTEAEWYNS